MNLSKIILFFLTILFCNACKKTANDKVFIVDDDLRCKPASGKIIEIPTDVKDTLLYQLALKNNSQRTQEVLLEFPIEQVDNIVVAQWSNKKVVQQYTFNSKKLSKRIYYDRNIVFPFTLKAQTTYAISFSIHEKDIHNYFNPEVLIWKKDAKYTRTQALELTRGVFYGILILFAFICFIITYLLGERNYYYYLLYLIAGVTYLFVKNNLGYELLWPDYPAVDIFLKKIMLSIYLITSVLFLRSFIQKRIHLPLLQNLLRSFILFGLSLVLISLIVGLLSSSAQKVFIIVQNIFAIVCFITVFITFMFVYFNSNERSVVLFSLLYFISFSFFLFYPQPEFGTDFFGVYIGQIFMYSNSFIIAAIISISTVYRVNQIIKDNEKLKREMSSINANSNFSLIQGQQNERTRVGRELHDGIGIMMSAVKMKMSTLKPSDTIERTKLQNIIYDIDKICGNIRAFSHNLLPPTLKKFGLNIALKDTLEDFRIKNKISVSYNSNIPENLSEVSQHLTYDIIRHFLIYFSETKPTEVNISIYVIPSVNEMQIRIQYANAYYNTTHSEINAIIAVVNLLNGTYTTNMINANNSKIQIEIPVLLNQ